MYTSRKWSSTAVEGVVISAFVLFFVANHDCTVRSMQRTPEQIKTNMTRHKIVPDVIDTFPEMSILMRYSEFVNADLGNELKYEDIEEYVPLISWKYEEGKYYTLMMLDPDSPTEQNPTKRSWVHWIVGNIPDHHVMEGEHIIEYQETRPANGTGFHRYVAMIFKQPQGKINFNESHIHQFNHIYSVIQFNPLQHRPVFQHLHTGTYNMNLGWLEAWRLLRLVWILLFLILCLIFEPVAGVRASSGVKRTRKPRITRTTAGPTTTVNFTIPPPIIRTQKEIEAAMIKSQIIPDLFTEAPKKLQVVSVKFEGKSLANLGNHLSIRDLEYWAPFIHWKSDESEFYTLMMLNLDVPTRENPSQREWIVWLMTNIPGCWVMRGDELIEYEEPDPEKGTETRQTEVS